MKITKEELAARLNGREYGEEVTGLDELEAKESGLVIIYGYSDDNTEFRGAMDDEISAWEGATHYLHRDGILSNPEREDCENCAKRLREEQKRCDKVEAKWGADGYSWVIETKLPYAPFDIMEDGEKFCRGIVIDHKHLSKL